MPLIWENDGQESTIVPSYWIFLPFFCYITHMPLFSRNRPDWVNRKQPNIAKTYLEYLEFYIVAY